MPTRQKIYERIGIPVGDHFKYRGDECWIDDRPALLVYDYEWGDWIKPRYETMQASWLYEHAETEKVEALPMEKWHYRGDEKNRKYEAWRMDRLKRK